MENPPEEQKIAPRTEFLRPQLPFLPSPNPTPTVSWVSSPQKKLSRCYLTNILIQSQKQFETIYFNLPNSPAQTKHRAKHFPSLLNNQGSKLNISNRCCRTVLLLFYVSSLPPFNCLQLVIRGNSPTPEKKIQ